MEKQRHDFLDSSHQEGEERNNKKRQRKSGKRGKKDNHHKSRKNKRRKELPSVEKHIEEKRFDPNEIIVVSSGEEDNFYDSDIILIEDSDTEESSKMSLRSKSLKEKQSSETKDKTIICSSEDEAEELMNYLIEAKRKEEELEASSSSTPKEIDENDPSLEIVLFVKWKFCNTIKHTLRKFQPFESLFNHYADLENVPVAKIFFETNAAKQILPTMTPESLGLNKFDVIEGCVFTEAVHRIVDDSVDDGKIEIKVQLPERRKNMTVRISPNNPLKNVMLQVAETFKVSVNSLKFYFDGELVQYNQTAADLDLEGGEIFDLKIVN